MNLGIFKPGQGYWVRVMTAVLAGLLTLLVAAWVNQQGKAAAEWLPKKHWNATASAVKGTATVGPVSLQTGPNDEGKFTTIGTASIESADAKSVKLGTVAMDKGKEIALVTRAVPVAGDAFNLNLTRIIGEMPVQPTYLGGGLAVGVIILGAMLVYWLVGMREKTVEFLIATDFEMKKVNWTSPREVLGHTWVVIGACVLLAASLYLIDIGFQFTFNKMGLIGK